METVVEPGFPSTLQGQPKFDSDLEGLRAGRRLMGIAKSIENFLRNQLDRLDSAIQKCEAVEKDNAVLQRMVVEFEQQKQDWEKRRVAEEERLYKAGEQLMQCWQQLETEKRKLGLD